jgi:hypothetical protein
MITNWHKSVLFRPDTIVPKLDFISMPYCTKYLERKNSPSRWLAGVSLWARFFASVSNQSLR